jgi:hypothetical protein
MMPVVNQTADLGQYFGVLPPIIPSKVLHETINALWRRNWENGDNGTENVSKQSFDVVKN